MDLILTVVIAASIPSAITGFCFWCIEQKIQKQSKKREDEERERREDVYKRQGYNKNVPKKCGQTKRNDPEGSHKKRAGHTKKRSEPNHDERRI